MLYGLNILWILLTCLVVLQSEEIKFEGVYHPNGQRKFGKSFLNNGDIYTGGFEDDKREGIAEYLWTTGALFKGLFNDDHMVKGEVSFPDGTLYRGTMKNEKYEGDNCYHRFSNGDEFVGRFVAGVRSGYGQYNFAGGRGIYKGGYKNDAYHGKGRFEGPHGVYEGNYARNQRHGFGVFYPPSGRPFRGWWNDGLFVGSPPVDSSPSDEPSLAGKIREQECASSELSREQDADIDAGGDPDPLARMAFDSFFPSYTTRWEDRINRLLSSFLRALVAMGRLLALACCVLAVSCIDTMIGAKGSAICTQQVLSIPGHAPSELGVALSEESKHEHSSKKARVLKAPPDPKETDHFTGGGAHDKGSALSSAHNQHEESKEAMASPVRPARERLSITVTAPSDDSDSEGSQSGDSLASWEFAEEPGVET